MSFVLIFATCAADMTYDTDYGSFVRRARHPERSEGSELRARETSTLGGQCSGCPPCSHEPKDALGTDQRCVLTLLDTDGFEEFPLDVLL